jgi:hypothetical protein
VNVSIATSVGADLINMCHWRQHCLLPGTVAWTPEALDAERVRIEQLLAKRRRHTPALAWRMAASGMVGAAAFAALPGFGIAAGPWLIGFLLGAGLYLLVDLLRSRGLPMQDLVVMRAALEPLSEDRPGDGELARVVAELFEIDDPRQYDYGGHQHRLHELGRPITRLECLDLVALYQRERAEEADARRRETDRAAIEALQPKAGTEAAAA